MRFKMADIFSVSLLKSSKSSWRSWIPTMFACVCKAIFDCRLLILEENPWFLAFSKKLT